jgi:hypothetical protein
MKTLALLSLCLLSACADMTPTQRTLNVIGGVLVLGAIAAHRVDHEGIVQPVAKGAAGPACQAQKGC